MTGTVQQLVIPKRPESYMMRFGRIRKQQEKVVEYNGMFPNVDNVLFMYTYNVPCYRMLLIFSTLVFVTKSSKHL